MNFTGHKNSIFNINNELKFSELALEVFRYQYKNNLVYKKFVDLLGVKVQDIDSITKIPFLPIQFFKSHRVVSNLDKIQEVFYSSGTTGSIPSKHFVSDTDIYVESFVRGFEHFYGNISDYTILGLLPSYLERDGSSLVYMVDNLIKRTSSAESGFYLNNFEDLKRVLIKLESENKKTLLIGVSFALLDFFEKYKLKLSNTIVMETGGMKGRRKELLKMELHEILSSESGLDMIHSEYGMTELLSQAYSKGNGVFECPPWMKILLRDTEDPLTVLSGVNSGAINVIDLANINSCSFIATQDLGKFIDEKSFEVIGRFDNSDIRGCNLMVL